MEILAIDVGGTKVDMGIVKDGKLIARDRFLNSPSENIVNLISSYTKDKDIDGVGIGVAGQVDYETGTVIFGGNIGWENFPLGRLLQEELNVPVFVENDANIFALGVWKYELSSKPESVLGVTLGTGIGGGFVYEGDLLRSKRGATLEIGHMVIEAEGPACTCGSHGCLESLAGGWALEKWYSERTGEKLTGAQIHERARSGDKEAIFLYQRLGYYLGIACASLVNILNPDIIVLGGSISATFPLWQDIYEAEIRRRAVPPVKDTPTVVSTLKEAALLGASALVEQALTR